MATDTMNMVIFLTAERQAYRKGRKDDCSAIFAVYFLCALCGLKQIV
jgi:hypothetical protein